jgi:MFS superfamily sulfate permease-like transporter
VIAIMVGWRWAPAKLAAVPGPLVAIVLVTIVSVVFPFHVSRISHWQQQHHATGGKLHIDGVLEHGHSTRMLQW